MSDDDLPLSAVALVLELYPGEAYARAIFIPATEFSPERVKSAKRRLMHTMSSVVARAAARKPTLRLHFHTAQGFTTNYDVVVTGVIVRVDFTPVVEEDEL